MARDGPQATIDAAAARWTIGSREGWLCAGPRSASPMSPFDQCACRRVARRATGEASQGQSPALTPGQRRRQAPPC